MIDIVCNYLNVNNIEKISDAIYKIEEDKYCFILTLKQVSQFYSNFRKLCESELNAHIDLEFRPYINYAKYYADRLYDSEEYKILESMVVLDNKYKIGIFSEYDYQNSLQQRFTQ